jgi:purine-cytosine permease-like protein
VARVRFGNFSVQLPDNRIVRVTLGVLFVLLGLFFGWLPVLGYWMVPVGFLILAADIPPIRRFNRRMTVRFFSWWNSRKPHEERKAARNGGVGKPAGSGPS